MFCAFDVFEVIELHDKRLYATARAFYCDGDGERLELENVGVIVGNGPTVAHADLDAETQQLVTDHLVAHVRKKVAQPSWMALD
jgi:hypothetical protein